ncbi:ferritin-like domain-containing protein [Sphingomonas mucosissima]|uniref:Ferritin-like domain protein n=1 Tax=Sphingomonas mucosissima TaxID=370959 RepID=A0A245ZIP9_9SPHN|nr:ferritin-like domain-containing protein [Sphingomonas mucosissima]OWK29607.1 hypothetical protein SPMU_20270 [Sphingomonas mucosissima]
MTDHDNLPQSPAATGTDRRAERRRFLQLAGGASVAAGGLALLSACGGDDDDGDPTPNPSPSPTPSPTSSTNADRQSINFALQLEYLQAQYFSYATTGAGVPADLLTGTGTAGVVTGGAAVTFADPFIAACAREIAADSPRRIAFLRGIITADAVAQPAINISGAANGPFSVALEESFDPYANDENFLLGAFFLQDVIVTAYKGLQPLIAVAATRLGFYGLLAAQSYHAGLIRMELYRNPALRERAARFSDKRDALDGAGDLDQGVTAGAAANISPADANGIAFSRSTPRVLNILYANTKSVPSGGFFPAGLNGDLKISGGS